MVITDRKTQTWNCSYDKPTERYRLGAPHCTNCNIIIDDGGNCKNNIKIINNCKIPTITTIGNMRYISMQFYNLEVSYNGIIALYRWMIYNRKSHWNQLMGGYPRDLWHLHMLDILIVNFHGVGFSSICWTSPETSSHVIGAYLSAHVCIWICMGLHPISWTIAKIAINGYKYGWYFKHPLNGSRLCHWASHM